MTQVETKNTNSKQTQVIPLMGFDLGNRFVKAGIPGKLISYPSFQKVREQYQDIDPARIPANSWLIKVGSVEYVVGKLASDFQAIPSFMLEKSDVAPQLFYAAIAALGVSGRVEIEKLRATTPNTQNTHQLTRMKELEGDHTFSANGREVSLLVKKVSLFDEGLPAWIHACTKGLWQYPLALNGVLDLGGGTAIARLFTPQGTVIRGSERVLPGTFVLANKIESAIGTSGLTPLILDAIEDQTYVLPGGLNFKSEFLSAKDVWLAKIRAEMKSMWAPYDGQYAQVLVVGGSAPLAADLVSSGHRYLMADNPQGFSLEGLLND